MMKKGLNIALWIVQGLLALLFVFAGVAKLMMSPVQLAMIPLPALLLQFVSVCEILGGLGMVVPGIFRMNKSLTPLAAAGLAIIMVGAVVISVALMGVVAAIMPLVTLILIGFVAWGRWKVAPSGGKKN